MEQEDIKNFAELKDICFSVKREKIKIKAWDRYVWIKEMTVGERLDVEEVNNTFNDKKSGRLVFELLRRCLQNADGENIVGPDVTFEEFSQSASGGWFEVSTHALRINKLDIDEVKKN